MRKVHDVVLNVVFYHRFGAHTSRLEEKLCELSSASNSKVFMLFKVTVYSLLMNYSYQIFGGFGLKI